jgi:hypothetical protein
MNAMERKQRMRTIDKLGAVLEYILRRVIAGEILLLIWLWVTR